MWSGSPRSVRARYSAGTAAVVTFVAERAMSEPRTSLFPPFTMILHERALSSVDETVHTVIGSSPKHSEKLTRTPASSNSHSVTSRACMLALTASHTSVPSGSGTSGIVHKLLACAPPARNSVAIVAAIASVRRICASPFRHGDRGGRLHPLCRHVQGGSQEALFERGQVSDGRTDLRLTNRALILIDIARNAGRSDAVINVRADQIASSARHV